MRVTALAVMCGVAASAGVSTVHAADLPLLATQPAIPAGPAPWYSNVYVHLGAAAVIPDAGAKIYAGGVRVPGATIKTNTQYTAAVEIGYKFTPNWGASLSLGVPPTALIYGSGTVAGVGKFGSTVYGPTALTAHYHFTNFGRFQPYIGAGPLYMIAFNSVDGAVTNLQVRSAWGAVAQVGADYMITDHFGLFVDYKKAYLRTEAVGALGAVPIFSKVKLDPSVVTAGLTYKF